MKMNQADPKLTTRYFLVGNIYLSALVLVIVLIQAFRGREQVIDENLKQVDNMSKVVEEAMLATFSSIDVVLDQFVHDVEKAGSPYKISEEDLQAYKGRIEKTKSLNLAWADASGDMQWYSTYSKTDSTKQKVNLADRDYFKQLKDTNTKDMVVTQPYFGKVRKNWVVIFARRMHTRDGKFLGVVWCSFGQEFFQGLKGKINVTGNDVFVASTGTPPLFMFRYPEKKELIGKPFIPAKEALAVFEHKAHRQSQLVTSPQDSMKRISSYSWIGEYPVLIVVGKDLENVLEPWRNQLIFSVGLTIFGIAALLALTIYFSISHQNFRQYQFQLASSAKFVALGEMSGAIAHEINNPLMIITGTTSKMSRLLKQEIQKNSAGLKELEGGIEKINKTVERISNIVVGLKKVSRQSDSSFEVMSLDEILKEVVSLSGERFQVSGVLLTTDFKSKGVLVRVNETQILQVLINLLNNSFDQVREYSNKWVSITTVVKGMRVEIAVTDSGLGIPEEIAKNMMQPFYTTKAIGKGTGLGLSISKEIIEAHDGKLWYDSNSPNTKFVIELPIIRDLGLPFSKSLS